MITTLLLALLAAAPRAQTTHEDWRVLETGHYRVHYPLAAEPWVLQAASRWEAIHAVVAETVGHDMERTVDVVVMDPYGQANGFAQPGLAKPRMGVFPTAPPAGSSLAHFHDWGDDLVTHEDVHLVHLDQRSRNPLGAFTTRWLLGYGPVTLKSPMWVIEGYATMLEGKLTGAGRPHGGARAAVLRSLALEGALPSYGELDGTEAWQGRRLPYLVGSAFFEWLVEQHGEQSARDLWARLTARKIRFFEEAFEGVYGASPEQLYDRFCAELTHKALSVEERRPPTPDTLWQAMDRGTGAPALSPDGTRLAVVEEHESLGFRLLVLDTAPNERAAQDWQESVDKVLARDPLDVAPVHSGPFAHEELARWWSGGQRPVGPRWLVDGSGLLFTAWTRQPTGELRPELWLWELEGRPRRLTQGEAVRDADPHPSGAWAAAVQQRWGASRIVRVDLSSGAVQGLAELETDLVLDQPRFDPSGAQLAWLQHRGHWEIALRDLASGTDRVLPLPEGSEPLHIAWESGGQSLVVSLARDGFVELERVFPDGRPPLRLSQTGTAALAPSPGPEGTAYLVLHSGGMDLHWLAAEAPLPPDLPVRAEPPVVPLTPPGEAPRFEPTSLTMPPRDYGLGKPEWMVLAGGASWKDGGIYDLGLRAGDIVGRWEALAQLSLPSWTDSPGGAALHAAWRGWPVELRAQAFTLRQGVVERGGADLHVSALRFGPDRWGRVAAGAWADSGGAEAAEPYRLAAWAQAAGGQRHWWGPAWIEGAAELDLQQGSAGGAATQLGRGAADLGLGYGPVGLVGGYGRGATTATSELGLLSLGGSHIALLPPAWQSNRIAAPALPLGSASGRQHQQWRGALEVEGALEVFFERHQLWDAPHADPASASQLGLELNTGAAPSPLVRTPGLELGAGLACVLEAPGEGWRSEPCRQKEHWGGWLTLQWRP